MTILERIMNCMKIKGISQVELVSKLGKSQQLFSSWKSGHSDSYRKYLPEIAGILGVSVETLLSDEISFGDLEPIPLADKYSKLPLYGNVSAGVGTHATDEVIGYVITDGEYDPHEYFWLTVKGDSMSPRLDSGDRVLVHRQSSVDVGDVGVFLIDGEEGVIKKVDYDERRITLISFNPFYPERVFRNEDVLRVNVIGKVIKAERKF